MTKDTLENTVDGAEDQAACQTEETCECACPSVESVDAIIRKRVYGAIGIGFVPVPLVDFLGLSALQLELIHALAKAHGVEFKKERVKSIISSLCGGILTTASVPLAASLLKSLPVIGITAGAATISLMNSAVRQTIGSYRPDDLYSTARQELQDQMLVDAVEEMGRIPILIQGFVVKSITLPEVLRNSIERKLVAEQEYLRYKYILLEAQQEARRKIFEAEGIKAYQMLVNEHMTQNFLRYEGIQATKDLASSSNAKIVVIGGKDGLPVILNADSPAGAAPVDPASKPAAQGADSRTATQTAGNQDAAQPEAAKPDAGKPDPSKGAQGKSTDSRFDASRSAAPRPDTARSNIGRPNAARPDTRSEARQDKGTEQSPSDGVGWISPGESVSDYIQRLDKSLLQPHRGGPVRQ